MAKRALVTGITGQDGSYLAELLLEKGYEVYGMMRRSSAPNLWRIQHILDRITLKPAEYEWVRANPARFVLAPGHAAPELEHVVEREDEHVVVEKHGIAGQVAAKLDPRTAEG